MNSGWELVGRIVEARLRQLGMNPTTAARHSGVEVQTWRAIRQAKRQSYSNSTLAAVEKTLGWHVGTIDEIRRADSDPAADHVLRAQIALRLKQLGWTVAEWEQRSGLPPGSLGASAKGLAADVKTEMAAAEALDWTPRGFEFVRSGGSMEFADPDPDSTPPPAAPHAMAASGSNVDMAALAAILGPLVEAVDRQTAALKEQNHRIEEVLERLDGADDERPENLPGRKKRRPALSISTAFRDAPKEPHVSEL